MLALTVLAARQVSSATPDASPADAGATLVATERPPVEDASPPPDAAATPVEVEVTEHVAQGHRLYQLGRYQEAIAEYRRAYELRADAQFLFQIAESYRQLGATEQALFYYDRCLAGEPEGPDRDIAERRIAELESLRAPTPAPPAPAPALITAPATPPPAGRPTPIWRRWWLWTTIGVVLAAAATAAALASRSEPSTPATDLGDKRFF